MRDNLTIEETYLERLQPISVLPEPITYGCAYCDFETGSMARLLQHLRHVNGHFDQETCRDCGRWTTLDRDFERRAWRHHRRRRRQGSCACGRRMISLSREPEHERLQQGVSGWRRPGLNSSNRPQRASDTSSSNSSSSSQHNNSTGSSSGSYSGTGANPRQLSGSDSTTPE